MPLPRLTRHAGRRLIATGAIAAVAVLGAPAVANAAPSLTDNPLTDVLGDLSGGGSSTPVVPAVPGAGSGTGTGTGAGSVPNPADSISAGAKCVEGLVTGIQVTVTGIADGLRDALVGFLGGGGETSVPVTNGTATTTLALTPDQLADLLDLSPERLAELLANGQESLEMTIEVVIGGVTQLVGVVIDFVECLASLIPVPAATTTPPSAAPTTQAPAPVPAVTTSAAPAQAVSYPGYAPTGGAPSDEGSPAALVGLGLLTAATGGGALWLRARRGVAG